MQNAIIALSAKSNLRVIVRSELPEMVDTRGRTVARAEPKLVAHFLPGGAPDWAIAEAKRRLNFAETIDIPIEQMIGVFDSEQAAKAYKWTQEEHDVVANHLRQQNELWFVVEPPKVGPPWKTYDSLGIKGTRTAQHVAEKNLETAEVTGTDIAHLIQYEEQNRNNDKILEAYRAAKAAEAEINAGDLVEA